MLNHGIICAREILTPCQWTITFPILYVVLFILLSNSDTQW